MNYDPYKQFSPKERADLFCKQYSLAYIKETINTLITRSRDENDITSLNYWNEVAIEIKKTFTNEIPKI